MHMLNHRSRARIYHFLRIRILKITLWASVIVGAFSLYVASVGGDFMGLYRFIMPMMPLVMLITALSLHAILRRTRVGE